jgi:protein-S-isoprenylcysteine O-methyltransferase Ste14
MLAVPPAPREHMAVIEYHDAPTLRSHLPSMETSDMRQTIVPILLTTGTISALAGVLKFSVSEDSPMYALPKWIGFGLIGLGIALLAVALVNMFALRSQLDQAGGGPR